YRAMVAEAEAALMPFEQSHGIRRQVRAGQVQMLGSSGTVTTLAGVHLALPRYIRALVDGSMLTFDQIELVSRHLAGLDIAGRASKDVLRSCRIFRAVARSSGGGTRRLAVRVKSARRRKPSSKDWLERQLNDPFVAEARRVGYRSRAAFKLIQLDSRFHLLA